MLRWACTVLRQSGSRWIQKALSGQLEVASPGGGREREWGVCWGGSGVGDIVDKFSDKLRQLLGTGPYDRAAMEIHIEACLKYIATQFKSRVDIVLGMYGRPEILEP